MTTQLFISYAAEDRNIMAQLVEQLEAAGLRVWVAPRNITPGMDYADAIIAAIDNSALVLLLFSAGADASPYVEREIQHAVSVGVPILPLRLGLVQPSRRMRYFLGTLQWLDLAEPPSSRDWDRVIALTGESMMLPATAHTSAREQKAAGQLAIADLSDVQRWGWSGSQLLDELIRLDYETLEELTAEHEGHARQWSPVFSDHPETWRLLVDRPGHIVGYWHFVPLFEEDYRRAREGKLMDGEITTEKVCVFELPGLYDIYFVTFSLRAAHRRPRSFLKLLDSLSVVIADLAAAGVLIREITANAYSPSGIALCRSLGLTYACDHVNHGRIYVGRLAQSLTVSVMHRYPKLISLYHQRGSPEV